MFVNNSECLNPLKGGTLQFFPPSISEVSLLTLYIQISIVSLGIKFHYMQNWRLVNFLLKNEYTQQVMIANKTTIQVFS